MMKYDEYRNAFNHILPYIYTLVNPFPDLYLSIYLSIYLSNMYIVIPTIFFPTLDAMVPVASQGAIKVFPGSWSMSEIRS